MRYRDRLAETCEYLSVGVLQRGPRVAGIRMRASKAPPAEAGGAATLEQ